MRILPQRMENEVTTCQDAARVSAVAPNTFKTPAVALCLIGLALCVSWLWWICRTDDSIPFLPRASPAQWIVYPKPPDALPHPAAWLPCEFRRSFTFAPEFSSVTIAARAFTHGVVLINGQPALNFPGTAWKTASEADITALLQPGTNQVSVTVSNRSGPPALWLAIYGDGRPLLVTGENGSGPLHETASSEKTGIPWHSDNNDPAPPFQNDRWAASFAGAAWEPAALASQPPAIRPGNDLYGRPSIAHSLRRAWPNVIAVFAVAMLLLGTWRWIAGLKLPPGPNLLRFAANPATATLVFSLIAWALLFANNLPQIAPLFGFDRDGHSEYINFILDKGSLPLASDGWQMYQPPLYYILCAGILFPFNVTASADSALLGLRVLSFLIGVGHILLLYACLRHVFPTQPSHQAMGLLLGAFLPSHLYLSHHITNETLAALLVTASLYFVLRLLHSRGTSGMWLSIGAGACLGLALLTKFSAVLVVPFALTALSWSTRDTGQNDPGGALNSRLFLTRALPAFAALLLACGWHFARTWYHFGNPLIGNWDAKLFAWWQEPGFHTASWYLGFGQTLVTPMFSSLHNFADGLYSSLWGDALGSGSSKMRFRPQWNLDLANAAWLLALLPTALVVAGFIRILANCTRRPTPEPVLWLGILSSFAFALIYMTLRVPSYAQVKAFYALPGLLAFCVLAAHGSAWLCARNRFVPPVLWTLVLTWALTVFTSLWISSSTPYTHVARGISDADHGHHESALKHFHRALLLDPAFTPASVAASASLQKMGRNAEARQAIAVALKNLKPDGMNRAFLPERAEILFQAAAVDVVDRKYGEAEQSLLRLLDLAPDHPVAWRQLAPCLELSGRPSEAIGARRQALRINPYDVRQHAQQALSYSLVGAHSAAVKHYRLGLQLEPENPELLNNLAWILSTSPEQSLRDGAEAVGLARRACDLTEYRQPVLLGTLAAAYAEAGDFDGAIATAQTAQDLATAAGQQAIAAKNEQHLELFRNRKPVRE